MAQDAAREIGVVRPPFGECDTVQTTCKQQRIGDHRGSSLGLLYRRTPALNRHAHNLARPREKPFSVDVFRILRDNLERTAVGRPEQKDDKRDPIRGARNKARPGACIFAVVFGLRENAPRLWFGSRFRMRRKVCGGR